MRKYVFAVAMAATLVTGAACSSNSGTPHPTTTPAASSTTMAPTTTAKATTTQAPAEGSGGQSHGSGTQSNGSTGNGHQAPANVPKPVPHQQQNPGPVGADGSTGNNLSPQYCAQNQDPGCPVGSYVGPNAIPNPNGDKNYVPCEGTICTNPDHGAGTDPQQNGGAVMENPNGNGDAVPCEGTICTNPNHGAGTDPSQNGGN